MGWNETRPRINPNSPTWDVVGGWARQEATEAYETLATTGDPLVAAEIRGRIRTLNEILEFAGIPRLGMVVDEHPPK